VQSTAGGFDNAYPMPASGWSYVGDPSDPKGYKYKDAKLVNGPIKTATLKKGNSLKGSGKGSGLLYSLAMNPDPVSIVLQLGAKRYCMSFGGSPPPPFQANKSFSAKSALAPTSCPP
jgi:hypothetical protein